MTYILDKAYQDKYRLKNLSALLNSKQMENSSDVRYVVINGAEINMADGKKYREGDVIILDPNSELAKDLLATNQIREAQ